MSLQREAATALGAALESALNGVLRLDPLLAGQLARFENKVIAIELQGLGLNLYLLPAAQRIDLLLSYAGEPDTVISGRPLSLAELMLGDSRRSLFAGEVTIRGDVELGQQFKRLLDGLDIDWEEHLSRVSGDIIAHQLGTVLRGLQGWGQQAVRSLGHNLGEYLQMETRLAANGESVTAFCAEVDRLRDDCERAAARVQRLQQRLDAGAA